MIQIKQNYDKTSPKNQFPSKEKFERSETIQYNGAKT